MTGNHDREAEVDDFDHSSTFFDEDVVELQVSMHCIDVMEESHRLSDLFEDAPGGRLSNYTISHRLGVLL